MKKITLIGGDVRIRILKEKLENDGYRVDTIGLFENDAADLKSSDAIILPVPSTKDGKTVFTPLTGKKIFLSDISQTLTKNQLVLCCNYKFADKNCIDYGANDGYALLNAVPTAEGAIKIAIEETDFTLHSSNALVIGYGRVGKILADRLQKMGCRVTVSARKFKDFSMLEALGFGYINTAELKTTKADYDIIFNTVDFKVIDDVNWKDCKCKLAVDLSSKGGFDIESANLAGVKAIFAAGLPGKTAPKTAAEILFKTIKEILYSHS